MSFKNKVVWVTGASSGAGEALVYAFNKEGAKLIISSRRKEELDAVKKKCKGEDENIFVLPLDLEKHDELDEKAKIAVEKFGKIDLLFNNGGISQRSLVMNTDIDVYKRLMNINYFGAVILTKAVLPSMIENAGGHIAVMSSLTGKFSAPLRSGYAASKHALHGFFDALRTEVYTNNIKVTIICAGYINTGIAINALTKNGTPQNYNDPGTENGMPPEIFAKKTIKAIKKDKEEYTLGGKEVLGVYLKRFVPKMFSKIIRKQNFR